VVVLYGRDPGDITNKRPLVISWPPPKDIDRGVGQFGEANPAEIMSQDLDKSPGITQQRIAALSDWIDDSKEDDGKTKLPVLAASPDQRKPVYWALQEGIKRAQFTPYATKYVFLLADIADESGEVKYIGPDE